MSEPIRMPNDPCARLDYPDSDGEAMEARMTAEGVAIVDLWYPSKHPPRPIQVELVHVRANDGVRLVFDFERDGWSIRQPVWSGMDITGWREVFFAHAWALDDHPRRES